MLAESVVALKAAGADVAATKGLLDAFAKLVARFNEKLDALDEADDHHEKDHLAHARYMKTKVFPLMNELRTLGDELETRCAANLWPLPSYREMLFIK